MDRYYKAGAAGAPPAHTENASAGYPTNGNPGSGTPATQPGAWWFHMMTEEIRAVLVAAGITPDKSDTGQLLAALQSQGLFGSAPTDDEVFATPTISGGTLTLNLNVARFFKVAFTANITTTTLQNVPANTKVAAFIVKLTADGTLRTWSWLTSTVKWDGGVAPTFISTNGKHMVFRIWTDDGGAGAGGNWYGQIVHMDL